MMAHRVGVSTREHSVSDMSVPMINVFRLIDAQLVVVARLVKFYSLSRVQIHGWAVATRKVLDDLFFEKS